MNSNRFSLSLGAGLATFCLVFASVSTTTTYAQQPTPHRRLAARPKTSASKSAATPVAAPAATPAQTPPPLAAPVEQGEPGDTTPPTDDAEKGPETETDIDASQSASFNSKDRIAIFTANVRVKDPRFELACDELTVYLNKGAAASGAATPDAAGTPPPLKPATPPVPGAEPTPAPPGGGIDHAVAKGHVIIIQRKAATKPGEEDKISIGRGGLGTFDNKTGDMVLKDWPNLEQNGSSLIATAQGTVMTIHRDSSMNTVGPSKTVLIQHGKGGTLDIPMAPSAPSTGNNRRGNNPPPAPAASPGRSTSAAANQH